MMGLPDNIKNTIAALLADVDIRSIATRVTITKTTSYGNYEQSNANGATLNFSCVATRLSEDGTQNSEGIITGAGLTLVVPDAVDFDTSTHIVKFNSIDYRIARIREVYLGNTTGATTANTIVAKILELERAI